MTTHEGPCDRRRHASPIVTSRFVVGGRLVATGFVAMLQYIGTLTPIQTIINRPDVRERMVAARERMKNVPPMPHPGPSRTQLLELAG